jgi:hypothetical protein
MTDTAFTGLNACEPMNYGQICSTRKIITSTLRNPLLYPLSYGGKIRAFSNGMPFLRVTQDRGHLTIGALRRIQPVSEVDAG